MLRLKPTALSLTIEEVKRCEHRRKYSKFLEEHDKCHGRVAGDSRDVIRAVRDARYNSRDAKQNIGNATGDAQGGTSSSLGKTTASPPSSSSQSGKPAPKPSPSASVYGSPALPLTQSSTDTRAGHSGMPDRADFEDESNDGESLTPIMGRLLLAMPPRRRLPPQMPLRQTDVGTGLSAPRGSGDHQRPASPRLPLSRPASLDTLDSIRAAAAEEGGSNDEPEAAARQITMRGGLISLLQDNVAANAQQPRSMWVVRDADPPQEPNDSDVMRHSDWRLHPTQRRPRSSVLRGSESVRLVSDGPDRRSAYLDSRDLENPETGLLGSPSQPGTEQTSRLGDEERESAHADIFNPDRPGFHVYDDSRPASSQPQTPQNLPEARHRSRLLGAFTAPAAGTGSATRPSGRTPRSSRRWALRRSPSPEGLSTPGFRGLYGGLENSDDATLFEQALMRIGQPRRSDASPGQQSS